MIRRTLGRTGLEVPPLGHGSMGLRGPRGWGVRVVSEGDADRFLNSVLDAGINCVGTCDPEHLTENLGCVAKGPLPPDLYEQVTSRVAAVGD